MSKSTDTVTNAHNWQLGAPVHLLTGLPNPNNKIPKDH